VEGGLLLLAPRLGAQRLPLVEPPRPPGPPPPPSGVGWRRPPPPSPPSPPYGRTPRGRPGQLEQQGLSLLGPGRYPTHRRALPCPQGAQHHGQRLPSRAAGQERAPRPTSPGGPLAAGRAWSRCGVAPSSRALQFGQLLQERVGNPGHPHRRLHRAERVRGRVGLQAVRALNRVVLPTLGSPTMPTCAMAPMVPGPASPGPVRRLPDRASICSSMSPVQLHRVLHGELRTIGSMNPATIIEVASPPRAPGSSGRRAGHRPLGDGGLVADVGVGLLDLHVGVGIRPLSGSRMRASQTHKGLHVACPSSTRSRPAVAGPPPVLGDRLGGDQ